MNTVSGRVVVRETGAGIPNLLVVALDVGAASTASAGAPKGGPVHPGSRHSRLASVLTGEQGQFQLAYEDPAGGARPRLALLVQAPEEVTAGEHPGGGAVLYYSPVPREDAAPAESFIVRLLADQLDRLGIPYPGSGLADLSEFDSGVALTDALRQRIRPRLATRMETHLRAAERTRRAFAEYDQSSVPLDVRADHTYFAPGDDLMAAQRAILLRDLERLHRSRSRRMYHMRMREGDLEGLDLRVDEQGRRTISALRFLDRIQGRYKGVDVERIRGALAPCREAAKAREIVQGITGAAPAAAPAQGPPPDPPAAPQETLDETIRRLVARHVEPATAAEGEMRFGVAPRPGQNEVTLSINTLELRGGPADVTAYHDFHDLQIAFEYIWKEVFDAYLEEQGRQAYAGWIERKAAYGIDDGQDPPIGGPNDLRRWLQDVGGVWSALQPEMDLPAILVPLMKKRDAEGRVEPPRPPVAAQQENENVAFAPPLPMLVEAAGRPYKFDVFAPDSCNYGILVTYRQEWKPLRYQVGDLVSTVPLAPRETRRYTKRRVVKKSRSRKEIEKALRIRRQDSADTKRADGEIVDQAVNRTNFKATAEGGATIGVLSASASVGLQQDSETRSSQTKKDFREAVLKAAEEYQQEHHLEVEVAESEELEETVSGEITNPNDEIPVTYLLYELQRVYQIRERIHRIRPVILVANEVPGPDEITDPWLRKQEWILRRAMLDDSFVAGLEALLRSEEADQDAVDALQANVDRLASVVEGIQQQVAATAAKTADAFSQLQTVQAAQAAAVAEQGTEGIFESIGEGLFGERKDEDPDAARIRVERARAAFDLFQRQEQDLRARLMSEMNALEAATDKCNQAVQEQKNRAAARDRLREHVRENILYYMQAIWDHEPPDQRFFRLYNRKALWVLEPGEEARIEVDAEQLGIQIPLPPDVAVEERDLVEIADLDNLIGYKGNYMIFPLRVRSYLTTFMMQDYLDEAMGLRDPDEFDNFTTEELIDYIQCVYNRDPAGFTDQDRERFRRQLEERLTAPRRESDIVIVPTDSLFIEALPGKHPLLEDFKLIHRAVDVKKAQAEVRRGELENLRLAARLLSGEREDPDVERKIVIERHSPDGDVIVAPEG